MRDRKWQHLAVFDVDGTLTRVRSIWEHLHRSLGIWESQGEKNLQAFLTGSIDYDEFARRDAAGYRGLSRSALMDIIQKVPFRPGVKECFDFLHTHHFHIALLSTGLDIMLDRIEDADTRIANELVFDQDVCAGEARIRIPIGGKTAIFYRMLRETDIPASRSVVIGDSIGDAEIMKHAGFSIAVDPADNSMDGIANAIIDGENLAEINGILAGSWLKTMQLE